MAIIGIWNDNAFQLCIKQDTSPLELLAFFPVPEQTNPVKKCSQVRKSPIAFLAVLLTKDTPDNWQIDYFQVSEHSSSESLDFEDYGNTPTDEPAEFPELHDCPHSVNKNFKHYRLTPNQPFFNNQPHFNKNGACRQCISSYPNDKN